MNIKTVLVIDDKKRNTVFDDLKEAAHDIGIELDLYQFNPGGAIENDLLDPETGNLIINKTVERFKERFNDKVFDVIACDWNLGVTNVNGLEVLRQITAIRQSLRDTPKIMYSGTLEDEIKKMVRGINNPAEGVAPNKAMDMFVKDVKMLASSEFIALSGREDLKEDLLPYLKHPIPLETLVPRILGEEKDLTFAVNCGHKYAGKSFFEVLAWIENSETLKSELIQDISEEAIAYLTHKVANS